jgi:hypothetical protein
MTNTEKIQLINELDEAIYILDQLDNVVVGNIIRRAKKKLKESWDRDDWYYGQVMKCLSE